MMVLIGSVFIPKDGRDRRVWMASTDGMFSVASLFLFMTRDVMASHSNLTSLWKIKAPPRVIAFGWSMLVSGMHGILTMDNLRRKKVIITNSCPMCLAEEESINHLLLNCKKHNPFGSWFWGGSSVMGLFQILCQPCLSIGG